MLNKPKFMSPSINMYGNSVIDLNSDTLPFSCIVDGDEAITHWQIVVSKLDSNSIVFDSGEQKLETPFYPINNRNQNIVFNIDLKKHFTKVLSGETYSYIPYILNTNSVYDKSKVYYEYIEDEDAYKQYEHSTSTWGSKYASLYVIDFVNSEKPYYWHISFRGKTNKVVSSSEEVFYANSIPNTAIYYSYDNKFADEDGVFLDELILKEDTPLTMRKIYFKSSYTQNESIPIKRYGWRITDTDNNYVVIDTITKNQIYGIEDNISCECNGLLNQTNYLIELYIETQNGYFDIFNRTKFKVAYDVKDIDADFEIIPLNTTSGVMLNWGNLRTTEGMVEGEDVGYIGNVPVRQEGAVDKNSFPVGSISIDIPRDSRVVFSDTANGKSLEINEDSYVVLSFQIDKTADEVMFEMSGYDATSNYISRKLYYDHNKNAMVYTVQNGNTITYDSVELSNASGETSWYVATLSPMKFDNGTYARLILAENIASNALFPSKNVFPSAETYPRIGLWEKIGEE